MTIKPIAAGQVRPFQGLSFAWSTIRDEDMVTVGTMSPKEANEVIEISMNILEKRKSMQIPLQETRSKSSVKPLKKKTPSLWHSIYKRRRPDGSNRRKGERGMARKTIVVGLLCALLWTFGAAAQLPETDPETGAKIQLGFRYWFSNADAKSNVSGIWAVKNSMWPTRWASATSTRPRAGSSGGSCRGIRSACRTWTWGLTGTD